MNTTNTRSLSSLLTAPNAAATESRTAANNATMPGMARKAKSALANKRSHLRQHEHVAFMERGRAPQTSGEQH